MTTKVHLRYPRSTQCQGAFPRRRNSLRLRSWESRARVLKQFGVEAAETRKSIAQEEDKCARERTVGVAQYVIGSR